MEYYFNTEFSPHRDCFAETDLLGGACQIYLREFAYAHHEIFAWGETDDDIIISLIKGVLIHEDLHYYIMECVDTNGNQEHDSIYTWIKEWMNDRHE